MGADRPPPSGRAAVMQLAGMGVELAASVLVFCGIGYWIDYHWPNVKPWGILICSLLGIVGGLYNLIRKALHQSLGLKPPSWRVPDDQSSGPQPPAAGGA
jgi:F0F1-type ATP synthase assembly protein I